MHGYWDWGVERYWDWGVERLDRGGHRRLATACMSRSLACMTIMQEACYDEATHVHPQGVHRPARPTRSSAQVQQCTRTGTRGMHKQVAQAASICLPCLAEFICLSKAVIVGSASSVYWLSPKPGTLAQHQQTQARPWGINQHRMKH